MRDRLVLALSIAIECLVAFLAVSCAWPLASLPLYFRWILFVEISMLLLLWGLKATIEGHVLWKSCPAALCVAGLCLIGIFQVAPLPKSWVGLLSPATVDVREKFQPGQDEMGNAWQSAATATLSLDPGVARIGLLEVIAMASLFVAVRNVYANPAAFIRFAWIMIANGVALSLLGMGQMASKNLHLLYWTFPTDGPVFGPFMPRTHGADYLNVCLGLALGLLLGTRYFLEADRSDWRELFRDSRILWLCCGLGIMFAGLMSTLARAGLASFVVAVVLGFALLALRFKGRRALAGGAIVVAAAAGFVFWQGPAAIVNRIQGTTLTDASLMDRVATWVRTFPLVAKFPLFGAGMGTFETLEMKIRPLGSEALYYYSWGQTHNDYLQLWIEGGPFALALALAFIAIVLTRGIRAFRRLGNTPLSRLTLGALIGFVAVLIHSFVDFGLRTPAVAALTAIVCAILLNLADLPTRRGGEGSMAMAQPNARLGQRLLALAQLFSLGAVAAYLVLDGWRIQQAERYRMAAKYNPERQIEYYAAARAVLPERAQFDAALANALFERYAKRRLRDDVSEIATLVAVGGEAGFPSVLGYCRFLPAATFGTDLETANSLFLQACQKSPLLYDAHDGLERVSAIGTYKKFRRARLDRLVQLAPCQPAPWFRSAGLALDEGDKARAFLCLRNALVAKKGLLPEILDVVPDRITRKELLTDVVRDDPELIAAAAEALSKRRGGLPENADYSKAVVDLLMKKTPLTANDAKLKARAHLSLGESKLAIETMRAEVAKAPRDANVRLEYATILANTDHEKEALGELQIVLAHAPNHSVAIDLRNQILDGAKEKQADPPIAPGGQAPGATILADSVDAKVRGAIVRVKNGNKTGNAVAIETFGASEGKAYLLTAAHGVKKGDDLEILVYGKRLREPDRKAASIYGATVVDATKKTERDLALLEIELPKGLTLEGLAVAPSEPAAAAPPFTAFANWLGDRTGPGMARSVIVNANKIVKKEGDRARFWISDHVPADGESGSPLVDAQGRLLGLCSGRDGAGQGAGYYTHVEEIRSFLQRHVKIDDPK